MSVIYNVVFASRCRSTHHKLAIDALRHVRGDDAVLWRNLFLQYHGSYLEGSKAPDTVFKDFKNHVLHVQDGWWGGAIKAVQTWYDRTVHALRQRDWEEAVYSAGVLSHYYTDPCQPFHTGQSEAEGAVHRAAEWSIFKCYHEFQNILEADLGGYPEMELPATPDWLADHVKAGAAAAHPHYEACIDHYDVARGAKNPLAGMDQEMKDRVARMVGHAAVGFARLLERAFDESQVQPPRVELTLHSLVAQMRQPINWVLRQLDDIRDRHAVAEIWRELQASGKVIEALPEDERLVRRLHAQEVRGVAIGEVDAEAARAPGAHYGEGTPKRHRSAEPITVRARGSRPRYTRGRRDLLSKSSGPPVVPLPSPASRAAAAAGPAVVTPAAAPLSRSGPTTGYVPVGLPPSAKSPAPPAAAVVPPKSSTGEPRPDAWSAPRVASLPETAPHVERTSSVPSRVEARIEPLVSRDRFARDADTPSDREEPTAASLDRTFRLPEPPARESEVRLARDPAREPSPPDTLDRGEYPLAERGSGPPRPDANAAPTRGRRFHLELNSPVADGPSIGNKTADRLRAVAIRTVADLLNASPEKTAARLSQRWITAEIIRQWQDQARLVCTIPGLRGHDAQILVGCGLLSADALSRQNPRQLLEAAESFCATSAGERALRGAAPPDLAEVTEWIDAAASARELRAA